ncbi:LysE family transporter [Priestia endophytica]|uniref:LysE family translocator n=1 Tax=Priestia endophytica TaxID=135735 RepID=UPI003D2D3D1F
MVTLFLANVLLGLSIALPVGTVTVEMTKQGLKNGFMHGWIVGLGGMTVNLLLIILLYSGLATFLSTPIIQMVMWLVGALFLLYIGYDSIKNADHDISRPGEKVKKSFTSSYLSGLLVAISPSNLIFWLSIFGTVLTNSLETSSSFQFLIVGIGILSGILIHDLGLMTIVAGTRRIFNTLYIKRVSVAAGFVLIGFSIYFLYQFIENMKVYF